MPTDTVPRHPVTLVFALAIIVAALVGTLYMMRRADAKVDALVSDEQELRVPVDVYEMQPVDLPREIEARGFLSGIEEVTVHSEVAGRIVSRPAGDGDRVEAGDVLLFVDDTFYALAVQRAEAELKRAQASFSEARSGVTQGEAQVAAAKAVLDNSQQEFDRVQDLYASDNAPQIEYDRIEVALRRAKADYAAAEASLSRIIDQRALAEATVDSADAALGEARARLDRCVVRAPVSGRVDRFMVDAGEYIIATAPLVEVIRLDRMKMVVELADTRIRLLEFFERAEVTADAIGGAVHEAVLHHIAPKMDPVSRKFRVELHVDNSDESLLSGMYGRAVIRAGALKDVLRVPREAVFKHYGVDYCFVISVDGENRESRARLRRVQVSEINGRLEDWRVLSGLEPEELVILSQRRELGDGVLVAVGRNVSNAGIAAGGV